MIHRFKSAAPTPLEALLVGAMLAAFIACDAEPGDHLEPTSTAAGGAVFLPSPLLFDDVTEEVGLDFHHAGGAGADYLMPAIMRGGVAVFDYDGDGDLDLYFTNSGDLQPGAAGGGLPNVLYRQEADGSFVDQSEASGLADPGYGMGIAIGDLDNDGDLDVFVANFGRDAVYRNRGDGTFENVSDELGLGNDGWSTSAAFLDYDRESLDMASCQVAIWPA